MAKLTDSPFGKIKPSELEKFFSKYGDANVLESAFSDFQDKGAAARNFNANMRSPGMAEQPIAGIEPTDLSATQKRVLDPVPWLVNLAGEGPRSQQSPASLQTWMKKQAEEEVKMAREQKAIMVLVASNPKYFMGRPPESFVTKKEAEDYLKLVKTLENKSEGLKKTIESRETIADKKSGGGWLGGAPSTGTVTGKGIAPSDTKVVGGKTFRRINNAWVQQ